jgi:chromate transporter
VTLTTAGSVRDLVGYFLKLGATGFGGPVALVGYMQRDLVHARQWFTDGEFSDGLALAQISPGPLAAQLATYLGWLRGGALGATLVTVAFVAPPFAMVLVLSALYVEVGELPWLQRAFAGVGAGVVCLLGRSAFVLTRSMLGRDALLWSIAMVNAAAVLFFQRESILLLLACGAAVLAVRAPRTPAPARLLVAPWLLLGLFGGVALSESAQLLVFFTQAGAAVFGSGLAIVPFLYAGVVEQREWLTEPQFLDAVAVSMITPGPVVIIATFIGYLVAGLTGAVAAAVGVFLPAYLIVLALAPRFTQLARNRRVRAFTIGVTAATTGAIAGAAALLSMRLLGDARTVLIALAVTLALLLRLRVPEPLLIIGAGVLGLIAF